MHGVTLAFISGRSLVDLQQRVGLLCALYAGNHGLEMTGQGGSVTLSPGVLESLPAMREVQDGLTLVDPLVNKLGGITAIQRHAAWHRRDVSAMLYGHWRLGDWHEEIRGASLISGTCTRETNMPSCAMASANLPKSTGLTM